MYLSQSIFQTKNKHLTILLRHIYSVIAFNIIIPMRRIGGTEEHPNPYYSISAIISELPGVNKMTDSPTNITPITITPENITLFSNKELSLNVWKSAPQTQTITSFFICYPFYSNINIHLIKT